MSKKNDIIKSATDLFYKKGYYSSSMDELGKKLRISKAAIYYYFKSKEELLVQIFEGTIRDSIEQLSKIANSDLCIIEMFRQAIRSHIWNLIIDKQPVMKIFFQEEGGLPNDIYRSIQEKKREYNKIMEDIYSEGVEEGVFKQTSDVALRINAILGMSTWVYKWYKPKGRYSAEEISDHFIKLLEKGFLVSSKNESDQTVTHPCLEKEWSDPEITFDEIIRKIKFHASMIETLTEQLETHPK